MARDTPPGSPRRPRGAALLLHPAAWAGLCLLLGAGYGLGLLPRQTAFVVWSVVLGAGAGYHTAPLRRWINRYPSQGYFVARRQARLAALALWVAGAVLIVRFPPLQPLDLRTWFFSLVDSPLVAALNAAWMTATMALAYLLLPPPEPPPFDKRREAVNRMRWTLTVLIFTIFYVGLSGSLAIAAPRVLPLMTSLFLAPVSFCVAYEAGSRN